MEILNVASTEDTPRVLLDRANAIFEIEGRSLPEDSEEFYEPVIDWIRKYSQHPLPDTELVFKLEYFNTGSSKLILNVILEIADIQGARITWYSLKNDEDMAEAGKEFADVIDIPFEHKTY